MNSHLNKQIVFRGTDANSADGAVILIHWRRQTVDEIYRCAERIDMKNIRYVLPLADQSTWYPRGFMRSLDDNEPRLSHALVAIDEAVSLLLEDGFSRDRIVLIDSLRVHA